MEQDDPWARPGPNVIKLFLSVINEYLYEARAFNPGKPFQPSLMFVGVARSLPYIGTPERFFDRAVSCFTNKY